MKNIERYNAFFSGKTLKGQCRDYTILKITDYTAVIRQVKVKDDENILGAKVKVYSFDLETSDGTTPTQRFFDKEMKQLMKTGKTKTGELKFKIL